MKKPLYIVNQDPELTSLKSELEEAAKSMKERLVFLNKQRETAWDETLGVVWEKVENRLADLNVLDRKEDDKSLSFENGVVYLADKDESPLTEFLSKLLNK